MTVVEPEISLDWNTDMWQTPDEIASLMAQLVLPTDGRILEPAAGTGQIIKFLPKHIDLWAVEINYARVKEQIKVGGLMHQLDRTWDIQHLLLEIPAAVRFNCAVLGLAQLKREVDSRSEKRPTKADFRESGGFEQEAAVMLGLYREDYYDKQTTQKGIFEVSVLKSRFTGETTVNLLFDERFGQFKNLAKSS